jgi:hypothetical protein
MVRQGRHVPMVEWRGISHTFLLCLLESTYSYTVTEDASPEKGWSTLSARLYSILGHPLGMPLVLLLDFLDKND